MFVNSSPIYSIYKYLVFDNIPYLGSSLQEYINIPKVHTNYVCYLLYTLYISKECLELYNLFT